MSVQHGEWDCCETSEAVKDTILHVFALDGNTFYPWPLVQGIVICLCICPSVRKLWHQLEPEGFQVHVLCFQFLYIPLWLLTKAGRTLKSAISNHGRLC